MKKFTLVTPDNVDLNVHLTPSEFEGKTDKAILIAPALGVPAKFYGQFSKYMAKWGFDVFAFDYRTSGSNGTGSPRLLDAGLYDINTVVEYLTTNYGKVAYVGHSLGGQLLGLARSAGKLDCAVFVASSIPDVANMSNKLRWQTRLLKYLLLPFLRTEGKFPTRKLGLSSQDLPGSIASDWGKWLRSKSYLFDHLTDEQLIRYQRVSIPILSIGFSDDQMAPSNNLEKLLQHYPRAKVTKRFIHIASTDSPCGHLGFFKGSSGMAYWPEFVNWLGSRVEDSING